MKWISLLIALFISLPLFAQDYLELVTIGQKFTTPTKFKNSTSSASEINYYADITLPLKIMDSIYFITGVSHNYYKTELDTDKIDKTFQSTVLKLGINKNLKQKWSATFMLLPRVSTDYNDFDMDDFQIGFAGLLKKKISNHFNYQFGLFYNQDLYGPYLTPLAGLYYQSKNKKFVTNLILPRAGTFSYKIHKQINTGLRFNATTASFKLYDTNSDTETYLHQKNNDIKVLGQIVVSDNFLIELLFGHTILKQYEVYYPDDKIDLGFIAFLFGDNRSQLNSDISDSFIREFKLIYRIATD